MGFETLGLGTDSTMDQYVLTRDIPYCPLHLERSARVSKTQTFHTCADLYDEISWANDSLEGKLFFGKNVVVYGSGRYHHISNALIKHRYQAPISLINIDNHCDAYSAGVRLSKIHDERCITCGTHVYESMTHGPVTQCLHISEQDPAYGIQIVGFSTPDNVLFEKQVDLTYIHQQSNKKLVEYDYIHKLFVKQLPNPVHLTIDIDVLSSKEFSLYPYETFTQGHMSLPTLLTIVEHIVGTKEVVGIDICGMTPDPRCEDIYDTLLNTIHKT